MKPLARFAAMLTGLVLLLHGTPSWGQPVCAFPGCNPTVSDVHTNTAGGTAALASLDYTVLPPLIAPQCNTGFGFNALFSTTTGFGNTATGFGALYGNTIGSFNTAAGFGALNFNTTGVGNTASGAEALWNNLTGVSNTASGRRALFSNTTGDRNAATGFEALLNNFTGVSNTATGALALFNNTAGNDNTASGQNALFSNTTGDRNTAVGQDALSQITGNKNIAIGFKAGINLVSGNNNIYLGSQGGDSTEYQTMRLGKGQTRTFIAGIAGASVTGVPVEIDTTTGQLGIATSSARYKPDITPMGSRGEKVLDLRPVTFAYKDDAHGVTHYGLIAEEVATVLPELVTHTATGEVQTVKYQELIPMLLNELQRQQQTLQSQQLALQAQGQALQRQQQELADLRALMGQGRETASLSR